MPGSSVKLAVEEAVIAIHGMRVEYMRYNDEQLHEALNEAYRHLVEARLRAYQAVYRLAQIERE